MYLQYRAKIVARYIGIGSRRRQNNLYIKLQQIIGILIDYRVGETEGETVLKRSKLETVDLVSYSTNQKPFKVRKIKTRKSHTKKKDLHIMHEIQIVCVFIGTASKL